MTASRRTWRTEPLTALSAEQQREWLQHCYVQPEYDALLLDSRRSVVIICRPGNGLSTSFTQLQLQLANALSHGTTAPESVPRFLAFTYGPDQWPDQPQALIKSQGKDHFHQFMAQIAQRCTDELQVSREKVLACPVTLHEFLAWLVRHYLGVRRGDRWLRLLEQFNPGEELQAMIDQVRQGELDTLYSNETVNDIYGQIDDCLDLAKFLGWEGIYALIDVSVSDWIERTASERAALRDGVEQLLRRLTPTQRPGFGFKIALPETVLSFERAQELSRNRAEVLRYSWPPTLLQQIARRMMDESEVGQSILEALLAPPVWQILKIDMDDIWGQPCPAAMTTLARYVLEHPLPMGQESFAKTLTDVRDYLYRHQAFLRRDPSPDQPVVWRGARPLVLDDAQLRVFDTIWHQRGNVVQNSTLQDVAGSKVNLDKIISRIRQAVEPFPQSRKYLYLHRSPSTGVWLDPSTCIFR